MFRHTVLKNLQAIDNSGKGTLYYGCVFIQFRSGYVWFVASYGWRIERGHRSHFDQDARSRLVSVINIAIYTSSRMIVS